MPPVVAPTASAAARRRLASRPAARQASPAAASAKRSGRERRRAVAGGSAPAATASGTWAALRQRPRYGNSVRGPMPQRPSASPAASAGTSPPSAHTAPSPVITTRRGTSLLARPLREDEVDERVHRAEGAPPDLLVGDRDVEAVLDQHHQLERVDRVEAERLAEDGRVVEEVARGDLEPEPAREELLHLAAEGVTIHGRPCLEHREAAVHVKRGPGDVGGGGRGEEEDGGCDLLGTGEAAERDLPRELVAPRLGHARHELRVDQARGDRVHRDVEARHLARQRLRERDQPALGGGVARCPLVPEEGGGRDQIHDAPTARGYHGAEGGARAEVGALEVGLDDAVPGLLGDHHEGRVVGDGGVVDEDIGRAAERHTQLGEEARHRLGVGHVGARRVRRHTRGTQRCECLVRLRPVLGACVVEADGGARVRERLRGRAPDAARAAGHEHAPAGEAHAASPARATSAATWPLAHTSRTSSAASGAASASAARSPRAPAAPKVSPRVSLGRTTVRGATPPSARASRPASAGGAAETSARTSDGVTPASSSAVATAAASPSPARAPASSGSKPAATPSTVPRTARRRARARSVRSSTRTAAPSAGARPGSRPPATSQRRRSSSSASAPPATSASARPARTRSAAWPRATSPEAAPALSVTDGPPRRYAMASSPAAAFDTVAAKRRGLAAAGPPSSSRRSKAALVRKQPKAVPSTTPRRGRGAPSVASRPAATSARPAASSASCVTRSARVARARTPSGSNARATSHDVTAPAPVMATASLMRGRARARRWCPQSRRSSRRRPRPPARAPSP